VLDLAVVCGLDLLACQVPLDRKPMSWGSWVAIGLVRYPLELRAMLTNQMAASDYQDYSHQSNTRPICTDIALIRSENPERPAIQELIKDIRTAYHQAYKNNLEIEHL
jgi:hypothetical protein